VWAPALKISIILFSGARVVIAHKQNFKLSLNKSVYKNLDVRDVESYGTNYSFKKLLVVNHEVHRMFVK